MGGCSSRHFGITLMLNLERSSLGTRLLIFILQLEAQKVLKIWEQTFLMKRYTGRFFSMWKKSKMGFSGSVYSSSFFWMSDFHIHLLMRTKSNTSYLLSAWHAREGRWFQSISFDWKKQAHSSYFTKSVVEGDLDGGRGGVEWGWIIGYKDTWQGPELEIAKIEGTSKCLSVFAFFLCIASILLVQPASSTFTICSALHSFRFLLVHGILSQSDFAASWLGVLVSNCRISQKGNWLAQIIILS